ncbi:rod shape-determining protein RodA [candidate division KSB1 bacterium]|nr:MAG: rod shape-determining protein RodA [candidate division KSB1 bacterium]
MKLDYSYLIVIFLLILAGFIAIYSSTYRIDTELVRNNFYKQLVWFFVGVICVLVIVYLPLKFFYHFAFFFYGISIILLALVLFIGKDTGGSSRWISIKYFNNIAFQPSEFAKISTVILLGRFLSSKKVNLSSLKDILITLTIVLIPLLLIIKEPDLSTAFVFIALLIPVLIWNNIPINYILFFSFLLISVLVIAILNLYFLIGWVFLVSLMTYLWQRKLILVSVVLILNLGVGILTPVLWNGLESYQKQRIKAFIDPGKDPKGAGYQVLQSQTAIGSGGITGKGFLKGTQTQLRFLPAQHTDFVFSVIGEEFGFLGVCSILVLFLIFILKGINFALSARSKFGEVIAIGFTSIFLFQIFVNIGMNVGIMPVTGLPLPLMSYGGSSFLSTMLMIGLLINVSMKKK